MAVPQYIKSIIQKKDEKINKIELHTGLFDKDIAELVQLLNENEHITELDIHRNNIGNGSSKVLSELKYIRKLNLSLNNFDDEGIEPLILNQNFSHIDLSRNNLSDIGACFIEKNSKQIFINISESPKISESVLKRVHAHINQLKSAETRSKAIFSDQSSALGVEIESRFELDKEKNVGDQSVSNK